MGHRLACFLVLGFRVPRISEPYTCSTLRKTNLRKNNRIKRLSKRRIALGEGVKALQTPASFGSYLQECKPISRSSFDSLVPIVIVTSTKRTFEEKNHTRTLRSPNTRYPKSPTKIRPMAKDPPGQLQQKKHCEKMFCDLELAKDPRTCWPVVVSQGFYMVCCVD